VTTLQCMLHEVVHVKLKPLVERHMELHVPDSANLHFECFESVHIHPFSRHYGSARTSHKATLLNYWPNSLMGT
jgi:hypothetical protein